MSKAVLISIKLKWVEKIITGKKTIEVRKTAPKLETPFKCYIYMSGQIGAHFANGFNLIPGKVVAEFTCTKIHKVDNKGSQFIIDNDIAVTNGVANRSCLDFDDMKRYLGTKDGYAWEIENLKIYDQPKEFREFYTLKKCNSCKVSGYQSNACQYDEKCVVPSIITRPPQSWCYVEEI